MYCLGILRSGNYAFSLCRVLEKNGFVFEVIATPCQIAKEGCGYCIKFPEEYMDVVLNEAYRNNTPIMEIYKVVPMFSKNKYQRIY